MNTIFLRIASVIKDFVITILMLGLLLAFTKLIKFIVLQVQEYASLSNQFAVEKETIERTSKYYIYNNFKGTRSLETSFELNTQAENLSNQIQSSQFTLLIIVIIALLAFLTLYFALDFLIEYTNKFKPWSVVFLVVTFTFSVFYNEIIDLKETGNGLCFMFTTMLSIISGIVLIGFILIFPNYIKTVY